MPRKEGAAPAATFAPIAIERLLDTITVVLLFASYLLVFDPGVGASDATTFRQVKLGGALVAGGCWLALVVLFFLAGHPGTLERLTLGLSKVLPQRVSERAGRLVRMFAEGLAI